MTSSVPFARKADNKYEIGGTYTSSSEETIDGVRRDAFRVYPSLLRMYQLGTPGKNKYFEVDAESPEKFREMEDIYFSNKITIVRQISLTDIMQEILAEQANRYEADVTDTAVVIDGALGNGIS